MSSSIEKLTVPCPFCDSTDIGAKYDPWADISEPEQPCGAASGIQGTQTIMTGQNCGMIHENPRVPNDLILQGHRNAQYSGHDSHDLMRVDSVHLALKRLRRHLPAKGVKMPDIGAFWSLVTWSGWPSIKQFR